MGFNVVRIAPSIRWKNDSLQIPTGSYAKYFELTDTLIEKCVKKKLRVILVLSDDTNTYKQFDQYCVYLDSVTRHYRNNRAVMAYVVYMEPSYKWKNTHVNDKLLISNWSRKWYYIIKKNAPNQLVTYGLDGLGNMFTWDPSALTCDFFSMHFYASSDNPVAAANEIAIPLKWMHDNMDEVWMLGETGFSGTVTGDSCLSNPLVGTAAAQRQYADSTIQKSLDCGCKGYAWWQYQEVMWDSCSSKHYGLITYYPSEILKEAASLFFTYSLRTAESPCLSIPDGYYNIYGSGYPNISGMVTDTSANPIKNAVVRAWTQGFFTRYSTFTNSQGQFTLYTPEDTLIHHLWISQKGYNSRSLNFNTPPTEPIILTRINYNKWKKHWTNENYPVSGTNPNIETTDTFVVGNFCGNKAQELLVVKFSSHTATMYDFHINHWESIWTGQIGDWLINSTDRFQAGDIDGDGYDELLCIQNASNSWVNFYRYDQHNLNHPWQSVWNNNGNGKIGIWNLTPSDVILLGHFNDSTYCSLLCINNNRPRPWSICQRFVSNSWESFWNSTFPLHARDVTSGTPTGFDQYYVGDFSGNGIDELLCIQKVDGGIDWMMLLQYDATWTTLWSNNGTSEGIGIYPYRNRLIVGNFDSDLADEILGVGAWATKFDLNTSNQWDWSWSSYESGKLSDWTVNPTHRIFFMKTMADVPDYLFVNRKIINNEYLFNAYSFDPK